jgi:MurNAc alpha-1-phosphate uridylyltransferase
MKALLLAAGRGERMGALTHNCPKPLLSIGKERLVERHLRRLKAAGVDEVVVNLHYLGSQIKAQLGDGRSYGVRIVYSEESSLLDTGGGARAALSLLGNDAPFLMISSDVVTDFDFRALTQLSPDLAHLVLVQNPAHHPSGDFSLNAKGAVLPGSALTYSGIGVIAPALIQSSTKACFAMREVLFPAAEQGRLTGCVHDGYWSDVGTPDRLQNTQADFEAGLCR